MVPDDLAIDFDPLQTLGFLVTDWVEQHCRVPGGVYEGEPLTFSGWQLFCTANHYRINANAVVDPRRDIGGGDAAGHLIRLPGGATRRNSY